jgi:thiol:disulfide interchange protein
MTGIRRIFPLAALAVLVAAVGPAQEKSVELVPVKYDALKQEVTKHRGKVVLVDFWAGY